MRRTITVHLLMLLACEFQTEGLGTRRPKLAPPVGDDGAPEDPEHHDGVRDTAPPSEGGHGGDGGSGDLETTTTSTEQDDGTTFTLADLGDADATSSDGGSSSAGDDGPPECVHDVCELGEALDHTCSSCAGIVCGASVYCCDTAWDATCRSMAEQLCGEDC